KDEKDTLRRIELVPELHEGNSKDEKDTIRRIELVPEIHEGNSKDEKDTLRRIELVPEIHEGNSKDEKDTLRRIELVPELAGQLNSQVAEQLFAEMRKNNYFLNNMSPSAHIFLVRNIVHHKKKKKERQTIKKMKRNVRNVSITLDTLGKAVAAPQTSLDTQTLLEPTCSLAGPTPERETSLCDIQPQRSCWGLEPSPPQQNMVGLISDFTYTKLVPLIYVCVILFSS
ncbi:hypothetical protein UPYG_G00095850, partial [Umbra pygmaea]